MRRLLPLMAALWLIASPAAAASTCSFETADAVMRLTASCITDSSIIVPDGFVLDGDNHTITAVDPPGGHFIGAVITNGGAWAGVRNVRIQAAGLSNACDAGAARLRGIRLEDASGFIEQVTIDGLNQGPSGCQEGNAVEVRNYPPSAETRTVTVSHNILVGWQKTGIVVTGGVVAHVAWNKVGASATQGQLAANSIQIGFGARALVEHNDVEGNSWAGADAAATAVLLYSPAAGTVVRQNNIIGGNADVGIYLLGDGVTVDNNRVFESGLDGSYDVGIGNYGTGNTITSNKVRGYDEAYEEVVGGRNKIVGHN